jgi:cytochrome c oxidase subunit IV
MLHHPVVSVRVYVAVFFALMILMTVTVAFAFINMGPFNDLVAMSIAIAKTLLIVLFFMHLRYSGRLTWIFAAIGVVFFMILVAYTMSDYLTRGIFGIAPALGSPYDPLGGGN